MTTKFCVYDNGKPATIKDNPWWDQYQFDTFDEAYKYAISWLGDYAPYNHQLNVNEPYSYSGYGDYLVIKEEEI